MPEVSFYILSTDAESERDLLACKLAEKAYRQGIFSVILTASTQHSLVLDDLLWTFRASSFLPHQIVTPELNSELPQIWICADANQATCSNTLINLAPTLPVNMNHFERILEILTQNETVLSAGRERYRLYQQAGAILKTHKL